MRQLILLAGLSGTLQLAQAQQPAAPATGGPVISVGLPTLAAGLGLQVEQRLGRHWSLGLWGARFFSSDFPGYQGGVLGRYFFRPTAPLGWYLQAQAGAFSHDAQLVSDYPGSSREPVATQLSGKGGGLALGYQLALGRHLTANAALGLRLYFNGWGHKLYDAHYLHDFNAIGQPGTPLDTQLSVGYRLW